jgi:uncharacterized protein (DUF2062 family)
MMTEELALKGFLRRKVVDRIMPLLKQGISPEKIALALAMGAVIGICPLIGATTAICIAVALALRLNQPAIQIANYLVYPLQIALLIPFFQFGAWLFGMAPLPLSAHHLIFMFHGNFWGTINTLWRIIFHAIVAWGLICPPTIAGLYYILKPLIRRLKAGQGTTPES